MGSGPLSEITVVDMTSYIAGPFACSLLADLGATVVKVEPPEGDMMRYYPSSLETESRTFLGVNRGKKAIVIDLKSRDGLEAFRRLAATADVLVENLRPGVMERLGIAYETLKSDNPRLIHLSLTGYGESGPMRGSAGYDQVLQSMTGIALCQGAARGVEPQLIQGSIVDFYASAMAALGIVAALFRRCESGTGQRVGVSLLAAALTMQAGRFVEAKGEPPGVDRDLHAGRVAGIHPTKDGYIYFQASTPRFWTRLCTLLDVTDLATDPRYDSVRKRGARGAELLPRLHAALARKTAAQWEELLRDQVPCALVRSINDMFDEPQIAAQGLVESMDHESLGSYRGLSRPIAFADPPLEPVSGAPGLGQHTAEILAGLGYSGPQIDDLRASKAVA